MTHYEWTPPDSLRKQVAARAAKDSVPESAIWVKRYQDLKNEAHAIFTRVDNDPEDDPRDADPWRDLFNKATYWLETRPWEN